MGKSGDKRKMRRIATFRGVRQFVDPKTGEIIETNEIDMQGVDINFEKVWMSHILMALEEIGNKKMKVLETLVKNRDGENKIVLTQRKIAKLSKSSLVTVSITMRALLKAKFIKQIAPGVYQISPNVIFKGSHNRRMYVLLKYQQGRNKQ